MPGLDKKMGIALEKSKGGKSVGRKSEWCRPSRGLYPNASRTRIAQKTGKSVSSITGYLNGRSNCPLTIATQIAELLGMTLEQLSKELKEQQARRKKQKAAVAATK